MLRHGRIFPRKTAWGARHRRWLQEQKFDHPAHQIALQEMVEAVKISKERVERLEAAIKEFVPEWSLAPVVQALQTLRGIDLIVAVTCATELGDLSRFDNPRQLDTSNNRAFRDWLLGVRRLEAILPGRIGSWASKAASPGERRRLCR